MIPIKFKNTNDFEKMYDNMVSGCNHSKIQMLDNWCAQNLRVHRFKDVVLAGFDTILEIIEDHKNVNTESKEFSSVKTYMTKTMYAKHFPRDEFLRHFDDLQVCPYCNRNYINTLSDYNLYELDHFYPESEYPILAVSFYNIVPCCPSCNHHKSAEKISYSPHDTRYSDADQLMKFAYHISDIDFWKNEKSIDICMYYDPIMKDNVDKFNLEEAYNFHKKEVQDILKKKRLYSDEYISSLLYNFPDLFNDVDDVKHMVYGASAKNQELLIEPLSKMKKDILRLEI